MINLTIDADNVVQRIRRLRVAVIAVIVAVLVIIVSVTLGILLPSSGKK